MHPDILLIDDEPRFRQMLARLLQSEGYAVAQADTARAGLRALEQTPVPLVLCDVKLPDASGVEVTKTIRQQHPTTEVILLTAYGTIPDGVQAMKNGAFDYLVKGDDNNKILPLVARALEKARLVAQVDALQRKLSGGITFASVIGTSEAIRQALRLAERVAPTDATVLLLGETGTGKEVFAQAIHAASRRAGRAFVALNCSAFSRELLESELFGHKAGAFTGALKDKKGLIEEADGGTLFLDEVGEMPPELQAKLLRVLETGDFLKVGDTRPHRANVRVVAATHRDLPAEVQKGGFREDLFYRLATFQITLPSLNERRGDIPALAAHFLTQFSAKLNRSFAGMEPAFLEKLTQHRWRGNVRELRNVLERACILADGPTLTLADLPLDLQTGTPDAPLSFSLQDLEKTHIRKVLAHTGGHKTETARLLGIGLTTLYAKIKEYGL